MIEAAPVFRLRFWHWQASIFTSHTIRSGPQFRHLLRATLVFYKSRRQLIDGVILVQVSEAPGSWPADRNLEPSVSCKTENREIG